MSLALLFPGQGTQHPAMLGWLDQRPEAAATLELMAAQIGRDWRLRLGDAPWATGNRVAQCLLTGLALAAWQCLAARLPTPSVMAGYSVGELAAFGAAGVFDSAAALGLARERADAMERSVAGSATGLLAVSGAGSDAVASACRRHGLAVAIELAADRCVLGGLSTALDDAALELTQGGYRCQRLAVGLASHTPWMAAASSDFAQRMGAVAFARAAGALVCNLTGEAVRGEPALRSALAGQLAQPVRWSRCMETIAQRLPRCVLEVGPGSTLSKLWNERFPEVPARSVDEFRGPDAIAAWVTGTLGAP